MTRASFGPGTVTLTSPLVLDGHGDYATGAGIGSTILRYTGTGPAIVNRVPVGETIHWGPRVLGLTIEGGGIELESTYKARVEDVRILRPNGVGLLTTRKQGKAFAAYNHFSNVTVELAGKPGNGIVLGAGSEVNMVLNCNASYAQRADVPLMHYGEPVDVLSGVGLLVASCHNTISGGQLDRCAYPLVVWHGESNRIDTATDNALIHAAVLLGAAENSIVLAVGRCDPLLPDGTPNPLYGRPNWPAILACNLTYGNRSEVRFRRDTEPPTGAVAYGGWDYAGWEAAGTGRDAAGTSMPNRWIPTPEHGKSALKWKLDGGGVLLR